MKTDESIIAVVGDTPEQVVARALAACTCPHPERHHLYAPSLLAQVMPNDGDWPFVLVLSEADASTLDLTAEGVRRYEAAGPLQ